MIYFIENTETGSVKIGYSMDDSATSRLKSLQTGSDAELKIIRTIDGNMDDERYIHGIFSFCRKRGEWFFPCDSLKDFINKVYFVDDIYLFDGHKNKDSNILKFILAFNNETCKFNYQAQILKEMPDNKIKVQFFSHMTGEATTTGIIDLNEYNIIMYDTQESWNIAYDLIANIDCFIELERHKQYNHKTGLRWTYKDEINYCLEEYYERVS